MALTWSLSQKHISRLDIRSRCVEWRDFKRFGDTAKAGVVVTMYVYVCDEMRAREIRVSCVPDEVELLWVEITTNEGLVYVGALYHPPKPRPTYSTVSLLDCLEVSIESLNRVYGDITVVHGKISTA